MANLFVLYCLIYVRIYSSKAELIEKAFDKPFSIFPNSNKNIEKLRKRQRLRIKQWK